MLPKFCSCLFWGAQKNRKKSRHSWILLRSLHRMPGLCLPVWILTEIRCQWWVVWVRYWNSLIGANDDLLFIYIYIYIYWQIHVFIYTILYVYYMLLMEGILHQLIGSLSHYLGVFKFGSTVPAAGLAPVASDEETWRNLKSKWQKRRKRNRFKTQKRRLKKQRKELMEWWEKISTVRRASLGASPKKVKETRRFYQERLAPLALVGYPRWGCCWCCAVVLRGVRAWRTWTHGSLLVCAYFWPWCPPQGDRGWVPWGLACCCACTSGLPFCAFLWDLAEMTKKKGYPIGRFCGKRRCRQRRGWKTRNFMEFLFLVFPYCFPSKRSQCCFAGWCWW